MEWNVYVEDINRREIKTYNIFDHSSFREEIKSIYSKCKDKKEFAEKVKKCTMYYFWCKCEWEIVISGFPSCKIVSEKKVDVYSQVMMNFEIFIEYVWDCLSK